MKCKVCNKDIPEDKEYCKDHEKLNEDFKIEENKQEKDPIQGEEKSNKKTEDNRVNKKNEDNFQDNKNTYGEPITENRNPRALVNKKLIIGGALGLLAIILVLFLVLNSSTTIDLNNYIEVSFSGYDKAGYGDINFDFERFNNDYGVKLLKNVNKNGGNTMGMYSSDSRSVSDMFLYECVNYTLSKYDNLENGEKVSLVWSVDQNLAKELYKVKLKYKDLEIKVSDLEELKTIDPFTGIDVIYTGISPYGSAEIKGNNSDLDFSFEIENNGNLKNGDKVEVYVSSYDGEAKKDDYSEQGYLLASTRKEFEVSGLGSYVDEIKQIPREGLESMSNQARDNQTAYVNRNWSDKWTLKSMDYIGSYLLTKKSPEIYDSENKFILVYKMVASFTDTGEIPQAEVEYYYSARFEDLMLTDGKLIVDLTDISRSSNSFEREYESSDSYWPRSYYFYGYESLDQLFSKEVGIYVDNFNYEVSEELK